MLRQYSNADMTLDVALDDSDSVREGVSPAASTPTFPASLNFPRKAAPLKVLQISFTRGQSENDVCEIG